jgi:hypothetical protein
MLQRRSAADVSSGGGCALIRSARLLGVLAAVACSGAPGAERSDHASLQAGVDSAANRLLSALRTNGSDSLMALMADDVVLMPPNEAVLKGKVAVRAGTTSRWRTSDHRARHLCAGLAPRAGWAMALRPRIVEQLGPSCNSVERAEGLWWLLEP